MIDTIIFNILFGIIIYGVFPAIALILLLGEKK